MSDCPRCGGTGFVTGDGPPDDDERKCLICKGTGELDADVARYISSLQREVWELRDKIEDWGFLRAIAIH